MSLYEEKLLLKKLKESISAGLMTPCPKLSRFYRKLCVRQVSFMSFAVVIVWSGRCCSGTESITALICSGRNRTEPDTGYSHSLDCF